MIHGKDIIIYEGGDTPVAIAASKSCTIDKQAGTIETSSPASGTARSYASGRTDWVCTMNNLVLSVKDSMLRVGETYFITMGVRGSSTDTVTGYAICTECNITGTVGNLAQGSFRFQGSDRDGTLPPQPGETGYDMTVDQVTSIVYNVVGDGYLSRLHNDTAQGLITFNAGAYIPTGQSLRIGDAYLTYDATNKMIKVWDGTGNEVRGFYATGSVSALGAANGSGGGGGGGGDLDRAGLFNILTGVPQDASEWISAKFLKLGNGLSAAADGTLNASGMVTSVGLTMPTGFTVTGSPITSSGTLAVSLASGYRLLTSSTATPGTYTKVTVDTYGRVTGGTSLSKTDIPTLDYIPITGSDSISGKLEPLTDASYDIGASGYRWRNGYFSGTVYATTFNGNATSASKLGTATVGSSTRPIYLDAGVPTQCGTSLGVSITGNAASATKATQDGAGNVITSKYVTLDTAQTINGAKTFSTTVRLNGYGIEDVSGAGLLIYHPTGSWTGISNSQWGVGSIDSQGVIRSNDNPLVHYKGGTNYNIIDASGGTLVGNLTISGNGGAYMLAGSTYTIGLHMGSGGTNRGIWEWSPGNKWLLYFDANNTIVNHGNVGIGTTSPGYKLHVNGTGYFSSDVQIRNTTYGGVAFTLASSNYSSRIFTISQRDTSGSWVANYMIFGSNGYVGVGNQYPSQMLHVGGNILATGGVTALSDMRQKTFLAGVSETMETLAELPIFYYKWKAKDRDEYMHIGTSAQAVQKTFPELVFGKDELSVDYGVLGTTIGILNSRALVTLEQRVTALENKLEERA